ncbi:MAG: Uma2 family endonuclease, partial [Vulcanimicrobiaceae bacterium]
MSDMALELPLRPITVDEYHRMVEVGIIDSEEHVELLDGRIVTMPPIGPPHYTAHGLIVEYLVQRLGERAFVAGQASVVLGVYDEPQPDIAVFARRVVSLAPERPSTDEIYALIEVADSSIRRDRGPKLRAYARGGIREYLIVELAAQRLRVQRKPNGEQYDSV